MFGLFGVEGATNDEEAQQQQRQQQTQEREPPTTSSNMELTSLSEKKSIKSVTFEENKSIKESQEDSTDPKVFSNEGMQNLQDVVGGVATGAMENSRKLVGSTVEKLMSIFLHTYIGKVEIDLENFLNFDELEGMDGSERVMEFDSRFISNKKKEGKAFGWVENKLGTFQGTVLVSKPMPDAKTELLMMTPKTPDIKRTPRFWGLTSYALLGGSSADNVNTPVEANTTNMLKKQKSISRSFHSDAEMSFMDGDIGSGFTHIRLKINSVSLCDVIDVDTFQRKNCCFLSCRLEKKGRRRNKNKWFRSGTVYKTNNPQFEEKKLKDFVFDIFHEKHKWQQSKLVFYIYHENEGAQEISNGLNFMGNYFTHVTLSQVSNSIWLDMESVSVNVLRFLAFIEIFAWLLICGYFAYISYIQGINQRYASLAEVNDGICEHVPRQLSLENWIGIGDGTQGVWSSNSGYNPNTTAYYIKLHNYESHYNEFETNIQITETKLKALSELGAERSIHWNLILWATFTNTQYIHGGGTYAFRLEGDVQTLFNKPKILAGMANKASGSCEVDATIARYDLGSQSLVMKIEDYFTTFGTMNGKCSQAFDPTSFGIQNASITPTINDLEIQVDMQTVSVALAINMGQIEMSELSRVALSGMNLSFPYDFCNTDEYFGYTSAGDAVCAGLEVVDWSAYYLPRYKGMQPVTCVTLKKDDGTGGSRNFCLVRVGDAVLYPSIHHVDPCSCTDINDDASVKAECNEQKLLTTLFFYPGETIGFFPLTLEAVAYLQTSIWDSPTGDDALNQLIYPSAAALSNRASENDIKAAITTMCPYFDCSVITFRTDAYFNNFAVNDYVFQVAEPACTPSVYDSRRFVDLMNNVPFSFYEKYQKCKLRWDDNWIQSVGISTGNASILTQLLMFALTLLVGQILKHFFQYSTGFGDTDYAADLAKKRRKAKKEKETFFGWLRRVWNGGEKVGKEEEEEEEEEVDWDDPKEHTRLKKDLNSQKHELHSLKKAFNVAIPEEKLKDVSSNVRLLEEQSKLIQEQQDIINSLKVNNDELRKRLDELDLKVLAADKDAKKAIRAVSSNSVSTPSNAGVANDDERSIVSNPGVVYSNAEKEEMREHLRRILIGAAPAGSK